MKAKRFFALLLALTMLVTMAACGETSAAGDIPNGDFELEHEAGQWNGWTREDAAFNVRGLVDTDKLNGAVMEKSGDLYFAGCVGGNPAMRGTLTSDVFKLGGNGFITFKMGAGKNTEKVYVEFIEANSHQVLAKVVNEDCDGVFITDHLITKIVDLSAHIGKQIYIKVTDNDDGNDFAYVNLDAFQVCTSDEEVEAARAEYARQIETYGEKPFQEDETSTTIQNPGFETGDLTGWVLLEGTALTRANVVPTSQYYWNDRSVYGEGEYYLDGSNNGITAENLTGAIRSSKFTLSGDGYISFMIGAGNGNSYVALCDGETDEELMVVHNDYFSDPALALTLLRTYMDASQYVGKVVYLKVVDANDGGGFAFINVDDFQVSLTAEEVAALEVAQLEKIQAETYTSASYDDLTTLLNYYTTYPYPVPLESLTLTSYVPNQVVDCGTVDVTAYLQEAAATYGDIPVTELTVRKVTVEDREITDGFQAVDMSVPGCYHVTYCADYEGRTVEAVFTVVAMENRNNVANGGFEAGNLAGWTPLTDTWSIVDGQPTGVISAQTYWGENLPYNQAGDYHMDGWSNGIGEAEGWQLRSTNFTLTGSGYISLRMGGNAAALRVFLADGTEVGYYKQTRFADQNFPSLAGGGSWADMGTYVVDLSAYLGQEMYLVLCDEVIDGGWAQAFFDEVVTYYETIPDYENLYDTVVDGATGDAVPGEVQIPWQLAQNLK
ncbi:MAG TPA: hypothetical protein IAB79_07515 [Candidatus Faecousia excrementipullorum]|nr:hypothetical protein [Candidatus Faecousia excrementipullorum]